MARKCKSYEELELSDDFMFAKVMQNKALCKELLELIMGFPIADIVYLEEQKTLDVAANAKVCVWMCMLRMRIRRFMILRCRQERKSIFRNEAVIIRES